MPKLPGVRDKSAPNWLVALGFVLSTLGGAGIKVSLDGDKGAAQSAETPVQVPVEFQVRLARQEDRIRDLETKFNGLMDSQTKLVERIDRLVDRVIAKNTGG